MKKMNLHASGKDDYIETLKIQLHNLIEEIKKLKIFSAREKKEKINEERRNISRKIKNSEHNLY